MSLVLAFVPKGKSGRACCAAAMDSLWALAGTEADREVAS
jgi:hypothetical protein